VFGAHGFFGSGAGRKTPLLAGRDRDLENVQALIERLNSGGYERSLV
jgi:hypothetical protein